MAAGAAAVLALMPGLPTLPFLALAGLAGGGAWLRYKHPAGRCRGRTPAPPVADASRRSATRCAWT